MPRAERIVEVIPATWNPIDESAGEIRKLRVAAYCRVSTELEQQQSSYDIQIEYYTRHIMQNPNWIFAGVFADDGRSATNTFRRDDFNQLMDQCLKGKVEFPIVKDTTPNMMNPRLYTTSYNKPQGQQFDDTAVLSFIKLQYT